MPCFHVGCKSGYSKGYVRSHLFKIPKGASQDVRQEWIRNIPKRKNLNFEPSRSVLCHLHFEEKFIIKNHFVRYGDTLSLGCERKHWTLTGDAVPTIFENNDVSTSHNRRLNKRHPPKLREHMESSKKAKISQAEHCQTFDILSVVDQIKLPSNWVSKSGLDETPCLTFYLLKDTTDAQILQIEKLVWIRQVPPSEGKAEISLNGKVVHGLQLQSIRSLDHIHQTLNLANSFSCCTGVRNYANQKICKGGELRGDVWFSSACQGRVDEINKKCDNCDKLYSVLRAMKSRERLKLSIENRIKNTPSNANKATDYVKQLKYKLRFTKSNLNRSIFNSARLRLLLSVLRKQMTSLAEDDMLTNILNCAVPDNFKLAMKTAIQNAKRKSSRGHRFESAWLLQCMLLKIKSPKSYTHLRNNQMLPLPHPSTLQRLIRGMPCEFGFTDFVFQQFQKEYTNKSMKQKEGVVMFDEIKVREELAYDKVNFNFNGFIDYGSECKEENIKNVGVLADHALVFMFRSQLNKTIQPLGSFATRRAAPGNILAKLLISCICRLEESGIRVSGVISDGATTNKNMWKLLAINGSFYNTTNKVSHPCDKDGKRFLYFFSDVPHIIKCIRNHFFKHQLLLYKGKNINSGYYKAVYDLDKELPGGLRIIPKISDAHISPTTFQKMRVSLATQIFSKSMADAIQFYRRRNQKFLAGSEVTEQFTQDINDLFDALNARYSLIGVKLNSSQYKTMEGFRETLKLEDNHILFASNVTLASLRVTLQSFLDIILYWTKLGFDYVLTGKISQDSLERFFGIVRHAAGDEDHPTVISFMHLYRLLCLYTPTAKMIKGNVTTPNDDPLAMVKYADVLLRRGNEKCNESKKRRKEVDDAILANIIATHEASILDQSNCHLRDHDYCKATVSDCIVHQLCGYLAHRASKLGQFTKCKHCISTLFSYKSDQRQEAELTSAKSLGFLKYPSDSLLQLIQHSVELKINELLKTKMHGAKVTEIVESLTIMDCSGIGCNAEDHSEKLGARLVSFYLSIRMYFFTKQYNKQLLTSRAEAKKHRKLAKLN